MIPRFDALTPEQRARKDDEVAQQLRLCSNKQIPKWTLVDKNILEDSPSHQDGLPKEKVALWHRQICTLLQKAGMNLRIPQWGIGMAMFLTQRFFRRKSMRRNDRFVIAMACLHLAAKMEEAPKSIKDLVKESIKIRYSYLGKEVEARIHNQEYLDQHKEEILVAERAVLYTLGFDLNAQHPYSYLVNRLAALGLLQANTQEGNPFKFLMQNTWNFTNDSFRTTLCLQFPAETIAYGALYMAHRLNLHVYPHSSLEILLKEKTQDRNMTFFKFFEIRPEDIAEVERQITSVYKQSKLATVQQQQLLHEQQQQLLDPTAQGQAALPFHQQQYQNALQQTQQSPLFFSPSPGYTPSHASMPTTPGHPFPSPTEPFPAQHPS
mmetsp:Transcript_4423/g.12030  ORF Transcript_4423/g.12030 Transcript_4423/m.12030 type:complete len:379 (+) Transcript_4423:97-1233(+)